MLDDRLFGDAEIAFEVFPQTPQPLDLSGISPEFHKKCLNFMHNFRPIIARPKIKSLGGDGSMVLLIPNGVSKAHPLEPSYDVIAINEKGDHIIRRSIDHLPVARNREQRNRTVPPKERIKLLCATFIENRLGQVFEAQHFDKSTTPDLSVLFEETQIATITDKVKNAALASSREIIFRQSPEPEVIDTTPDYSEIETHFSQALALATNAFAERAFSPRIREVMQTLTGQQTSEVASYLNVRLSRAAQKKLKADTALTIEGIQANRAAVLAQHPLIASDISRFAAHSIAEKVDKGKASPDEALQDYWKTEGQKLSADALAFLRGLTEKEVPAEIAARLYTIAPYFNFIKNPKRYPQTLEEWEGFATLVDIDLEYSKVHFRRKGQTVREACTMLENGFDGSWKNLAAKLTHQHSSTRFTTAETILKMASRVGLSRLAPLAINMNRELKIAPNLRDPNHLIAYCDVITPERRKDLNAQAIRAIENDGLSPIGKFYEETPLSELVLMQQRFVDGPQKDWDKTIHRLAVTEKFSRAAGTQNILALPALPDNLQREFPKYQIVPVGNAGDAIQQLRNMQSSKAWDALEDMIYQHIHFIFCIKSIDGNTEAMCVLEEENTADGALKVKLREDIIGRNDEHVVLPNELMEKIARYITYVNGLNLRASEFRKSKEQLRLYAEKLIGERASIGHDTKNTEENVQAANRFDPSCPPALMIKPEDGLRFSCPAVQGGESAYAFIARLTRMIDPLLHAQPVHRLLATHLALTK